MSIFEAYDIRGIYGKDLTENVMLNLGKAVGTFIRGKRICVGYDTRLSSKKLFEALSKGLMSAGCEVISLGLVATPILYFYAWKNKIFGIMITASHNSKEWNGLKVVRPTGVSFVEETKRLKEIYSSGNFRDGKGRMIKTDSVKVYENFLKTKMGINKKKVVVECFGGAGIMGLSVLKKLGLGVISLHDKPDGNFCGVEKPEPMGENLSLLKETVIKEKADYGVAYDGDADRAVFVDDKGNEPNVSSVISIFVKYILSKKKGGSILLSEDCASEIEMTAKRFGGKVTWWRIGHDFIEDESFKENDVFSAEQSSHLYFDEFYPFSDGILATVYMAKILSEEKKKLSEVVGKLKTHPIKKLYFKVGTDKNKWRIMGVFRSEYPKALDIADGIKIRLNTVEWVLIRVSQTSPEINLCIEAKGEKRMKELIEKYSKMIKEA
jgi:phosphomannomutase / phosphoglucomutase